MISLFVKWIYKKYMSDIIAKNSEITKARSLLTDLNTSQLAAVTHESGPLLIVAGAGTGKTTVITERISWLILKKGAKPEEILALTFTDKAAGEMEERVDKLLPYGYVELWISTFHSFAERILKAHALDIGLPADFRLLDTTDAWMLVRKNLDRFNLKYYRPLGNPTKFIHALLSHFSRAKDELISPKDYLDFVENLKLNNDSEIIIDGEKIVGEGRADEISRLEEIANAYHVYEQLLLEESALDFGSLLTRAVELLKKRPQILEKYRRQFKYILVDEFQDTNIAQYELVKLLAAPTNNLTVVGDDDQCLPPGTKISTPIGNRAIEKIREGDEVLTAVGKGYIGTSRVNKVMKSRKKSRLLRIKTADNSILTVTDNHKMFCYVPRIDDRSRTYVYLMRSNHYGWRIGITNDLASRLRLERGADKIVGLRSFKDLEEAKYHEMMLSLTYQIPPVCFKEREDSVIKGKWLIQLFKNIDTEANARRLAKDLKIDLSSHHYALDSVTRGAGRRVKIHFELCHRNYRVKQSSAKFLKNPKISHLVSLETSDKSVIDNLINAGIMYTKAKKGIRIRKMSNNVRELDKFALHLVAITNGFIEYSFKVGKKQVQTLEALAMPAGNLLVGHYLPIQDGKQIEYEKIISIEEVKDNHEYVYDLEIDLTHNFIANGIVVHNSIYKFRGASISNILEFKKDFPESREIFLTENYRSKQNILDLAYTFIQQNNPNRLEVRLGTAGLSKKLISSKIDPGIITHLHAETMHGEAKQTVETILELKHKDQSLTWNDFAILVRANDHASLIIRALDEAGVPYELLASRGLYTKPIILDLLAYSRLLDNYHESSALYRILISPLSHLVESDVTNLLYWANRKSISVFETMRRAATFGFSEAAVIESNRLVALFEKHTSLARRSRVTEVLFAILEDTGYLKFLTHEDSEANHNSLRYLNEFYRKIADFEACHTEPTIKNFLSEIDLEIEAGEQGKMVRDPNEGPESVKILTCHASKGLEFRYVFITNLVDRRFPTDERRDPIELPDALVKEQLTEGNIHLEEERRLFYVACTRAKDGLFFTSAEDYGGARKKKLSRFLLELQEIGCFGKLQEVTKSYKKLQEDSLVQPQVTSGNSSSVTSSNLPVKFSFTQLKAFENCPLQYKYAHILKIPIKGRATFSFGKTIHATLQKFCELIRVQQVSPQASLFASTTPYTPPPTPSLDELYKLYNESWIDDWFDDATRKKEYYEKGKTLLRIFHEETVKNAPKPLYLEQYFNLKIGDYTIRGAIDRIDERPDGTLEIIDYKTGSSKSEKEIDKDQLYIYQLALQEVIGGKPGALTYYYVEDGTRVSFLGTSENLEKVKSKIRAGIEAIKASNFPPTASKEKCKHCDFKNICEFRIL